MFVLQCFMEYYKNMNEKKTGLLVYPVIYTDTSGLKQMHLFGKGVFFTDKDEGFEYQEKMNQKSDNRYDFWTNNIIPYNLKV